MAVKTNKVSRITARVDEQTSEVIETGLDVLQLSPSDFLRDAVPWGVMGELLVIKSHLPKLIPGPKDMIADAIDSYLRRLMTSPVFTETPIIAQVVDCKTIHQIVGLYEDFLKAVNAIDGYYFMRIDSFEDGDGTKKVSGWYVRRREEKK